jgi:hypothetical protein
MRSTASLSRFARVSVIAGLTTLAGLVSAGSASAVTLNGDWAPFNRCPVTNPTMLAADGVIRQAFCAAADSPSGSATIGSTTVTTGDTNLQFGLVTDTSTNPETVTAFSPPGGAVVAAPAQVPGGLLGLMCPSLIPVISQICQTLVNSPLNAVSAVVESAGDPSNINLLAQLQKGVPILTLPVKIQLQNPILGSNCFIGSDSNPILLHPENLTTPTVSNVRFKTNGTPAKGGPMFALVTNATQGDSTFSVPTASGCGGLLSLLIDPIVNAKLGLPSPSGSNSLVLNDSTNELASFVNSARLAPNEGKHLARAWQSAVLP